MKTRAEIRDQIEQIKLLMLDPDMSRQLRAESEFCLFTLRWVLGEDDD